MDSEIRDAIKALTAQAAVQAEQTQAIRLQLDEIRLELKSIRRDYVDLRDDNAGIRGDIAEMRSDMTEMRGDIAANTTAIRRAHVLIEENRAVIELVAEGVTATNQRLDSFKAEVRRRFDEQDSFFRTTMGQLASSHGGRLDRLEHHTGLN